MPTHTHLGSWHLFIGQPLKGRVGVFDFLSVHFTYAIHVIHLWNTQSIKRERKRKTLLYFYTKGLIPLFIFQEVHFQKTGKPLYYSTGIGHLGYLIHHKKIPFLFPCSVLVIIIFQVLDLNKSVSFLRFRPNQISLQPHSTKWSVGGSTFLPWGVLVHQDGAATFRALGVELWRESVPTYLSWNVA